MTSSNADSIVRMLLRRSVDTVTYDEVLALGAAAVPAIVSTLADDEAVPMMTELLGMLKLDDPITTLAPLLERKEGSISAAALSALARVRDARVLPLLIAALPRNRAAINAVGDHGDASALAALRSLLVPVPGIDGSRLPGREVLAQPWTVRDLDLAVAVAVAMAKLGDHSLAPFVIHLVSLVDPDDPGLGSDLRMSAAIALSVLTAPGIAGALRGALCDPSDEVAAEALRSCLYLGRIAEGEGFMDLIRRGGQLTGIGLWYLHALTGERPPGASGGPVNLSELNKWWMGVSTRLESDTCYRLGTPIDLGALVARLATDPLHLRDELRIHTGATCFHDRLGGDAVSKTELAEVEAWWTANSVKFPPGKLHRWGRAFAPRVVD